MRTYYTIIVYYEVETGGSGSCGGTCGSGSHRWRWWWSPVVVAGTGSGGGSHWWRWWWSLVVVVAVAVDDDIKHCTCSIETKFHCQ